MEAFKVLILFGLACISLVKSDLLSEKLQKIEHPIPKELIPISDPNLKDEELISSISSFLKDEADKAKSLETSDLNNNKGKYDEELLKESKNEIEEILKSLNNPNNKISIFEILNYYMELRYHFDLTKQVLDLKVNSNTINSFKNNDESEMITNFDTLIQHITITAFFGEYDVKSKDILKDRAGNTYFAMLKIYPFLFAKANFYENNRETRIRLLNKKVLDSIATIKKNIQTNEIHYEYPTKYYLSLVKNFKEFEEICGLMII